MTKDDVFAILLNSKGYISGEAISKELGLSRAAVNSAVKALRAEGLVISSVTNKGYLLESYPRRLTAGEIYSHLDHERTRSVICLETVDSTNNRLKEMLKDDPVPGTTIIANEQTGGRGRMGRSFSSPAGCGIYLSMLIRPKGQISDVSGITAWTAVAVHNAILSAYGIDTDIKWVNDLYLNGKKITGILTELSVEGEIGMVSSIIIGIGINVNHKPEDFPEELRDIATSISYGSSSGELDRSLLAAEVIRELDKMAALWPDGKKEYLDTYRRKCITLDKDVDVINYATGYKRSAHTIDINPDFSLKVRYEDGTIDDVRSGEVRVRGIS